MKRIFLASALLLCPLAAHAQTFIANPLYLGPTVAAAQSQVSKPKDAMTVYYGTALTPLTVGFYLGVDANGPAAFDVLGPVIIKPDPSGKNHAEHDVVIDVHGKYAGCVWELVAPISKEHVCALWYDGETETPPAHAAAKP